MEMTYPANPNIGQVYIDNRTGKVYTWAGINWHQTGTTPDVIPREAQLEMYPALKNAWEEYLMVRKLLGL